MGKVTLSFPPVPQGDKLAVSYSFMSDIYTLQSFSPARKKSGKNKSGAMPMSQSVNIDGTTFVQDDFVEISDLGAKC